MGYDFKLVNSERFYLPGTSNKWLHLATVHYGTREFICFTNYTQFYIEEITNGIGPFFIQDEQLAYALEQFLKEKQILSVAKPLIPDSTWYNNEHLHRNKSTK